MALPVSTRGSYSCRACKNNQGIKEREETKLQQLSSYL